MKSFWVRVSRGACAVGMTLGAAARAPAGECGGWDSPFGMPPGLNYFGYAAIEWDPDGDGALPPRLVVGGQFSAAGGLPFNAIASWDGETWSGLGGGMGDDRGPVWANVKALAKFDVDSDGPAPAQLIVGGDFDYAGDQQASSIALWDGMTWRSLGAGLVGFGAVCTSIVQWDPDGDGPTPAGIVAGGSFLRAGSADCRHIAFWNGNDWSPLGDGLNDQLFSLAVWDRDGAGPLPGTLVAGGDFISSGSNFIARIASWDGAAWRSLGTGTNGRVGALATFDPDDGGPRTPVLIAGGAFSTAGGRSARGIAQWDGDAWSALPGIQSQVLDIRIWDSDGNGPTLPQLYAFGTFITVGPQGQLIPRAARWDGSQWHPLTAGLSGAAFSASSWDSDGPGPNPPQLAVVGEFTDTFDTTTGTVIPNRVNFLALWDSTRWSPVGSGLFGTIKDLLAIDLDPSGPNDRDLIACGTFRRTRDAILEGLARWDGAAWQPFAASLGLRVEDLLPWDSDGDGPLPAVLVAGGQFGSADGVTPLNGVARWDGSAWQPFGQGVIVEANPLFPIVYALLAWDHDADGATPDRLVAAGDFRFPSSAGFTVSSIAFWDGVAWQPFGDATAQFIGTEDDVRDLALFDLDADGPLPPQVVAVGRFESSAGTILNGVARWDGFAWQPFANGLGATATAVATLDRDGAGPLARELYVGGEFDFVDGIDLNRIARWDGAAWQPLGQGIETSDGGVFEMAEWDADGAGPRGPELVVGGFFSAAGGKPADSIARWDGASWRVFGSGVQGLQIGGSLAGKVHALEVADLDGAPPGEDFLYVGGSITNAGGVPASASAVYRPNALEIFAQPVDREQCDLGEAAFEIVAEGGSGTAIYRWRRDGVPLVDDGRISGATTPTLRISPTVQGDTGNYDCVVEDDCANVTTRTAALSIELTLADMDCDCFITVGDIGGFVLALTDPAAYAKRYPTCAANLADLNDDGLVTVADIAPFVATLVP